MIFKFSKIKFSSGIITCVAVFSILAAATATIINIHNSMTISAVTIGTDGIYYETLDHSTFFISYFSSQNDVLSVYRQIF